MSKINNSNKKRIVFLAVLLIVIVMIPSLPLASNHGVQSNSVTYSSDGMAITMSGSTTIIAMDNQDYGTTWSIYRLNATSEIQENVSVVEIKRIDNASQNTVAMIMRDNDIQAAEIYAFDNGYIDASIVIENLLNTSASYIAVFAMTTGHQENASTTGVDMHYFHFSNPSQNVIASISASSWSYEDQYVTVSWQDEMSIFHSGLMEATLSENVIGLPFGPVAILPNETFSIDPIIEPLTQINTLTAQSASPDISSGAVVQPDIFINPGGGGGSGGGSSGGTPPSGLSISATPEHTTPESTIQVSGSLSNYGSGGVTFYLQAQDFGGTWHPISSGSITSFSWTALYGYKAIQEYAKNNYGKTYSNSVPVYIFNYPATGSLPEPLYDYDSNVIGQYTLGVSLDTPVPDTNSFEVGATYLSVYVGTAVNWDNNSASGVWSFNQELSYYGSIGFTAGNGGNQIQFQVTNYQDSMPTFSGTQLMTYLSSLLQTLVAKFVPGLSWLSTVSSLAFYSYGYQGHPPNPELIYFNDTGDFVSRTNVYYPILDGSSQPLHNFGIKTWNDAVSGDSTTPWQVLLQYDTSICLLHSASTGPYAASSASLIFEINMEAES